MKVITGTNELPTPLIASYMYYITYNPYWHAPDHLVRKTIAPKCLHGGMTYLKSHGYHVIAGLERESDGHRSDLGRLEGCGRGHAASQDPAGSGPAQLDGNPEIPVREPAGHLPSRHARSREIQPRQPKSQQWLRSRRGCETARHVASRPGAGLAWEHAGTSSCSCRGRRRSF